MDDTATTQGPDAAVVVGKHLARIGFADLPATVVKAVKESLTSPFRDRSPKLLGEPAVTRALRLHAMTPC